MSWTCPACQNTIAHSEVEVAPRSGITYRCPICRLELIVDLESLTVTAGGQKFSFTMPDSDRKSLASGTWDTTAMLLSNRDAIKAAASRIPYLRGFAATRGGARA